MKKSLICALLFLSASYDKLEGLELGFAFIADLVGFSAPLKLSCSSLNAARPLRYLETRYLTLPFIDWIYSF